MLSTVDPNHDAARAALTRLVGQDELLTHNYVVVETTALVARRLGSDAVRDLHERVLPPIRTVWVDEPAHSSAVSALLVAERASFVDLVSFEVMRRLRVERAFAFDRDFAAHGFDLVS